MEDIFTYTGVEIPEDCKVKISPSQISKFFELPKIWYEENVLLKNSNTSFYKDDNGRILGTTLHYIYEQVANSKEVTREAIDNLIDNYIDNNPDVIADKDIIKNNYISMAETVVNESIIPYKNFILATEKPLIYKLAEGIYLGGTVDRIDKYSDGSIVIVDYKNVESKPSSLDKIVFKYKIQMLAYAYLYYKLHFDKPTKISVIYSVRPTKTLPARCFTITENIDNNDWKLIKDTLDLIVGSIDLCWKQPELVPYLFKSMDLKV